MSVEQDPLRVAELKYGQLVESAQEVASAAAYHPNVAVDLESMPSIGNLRRDYENEEEALADLRTNALFLSQHWEEAQKYFQGPFANEYFGKYGGEEGLEEGPRQDYERMLEKLEMVQAELWMLDRAVAHVLGNPPSDDECSVKLQGEDFNGNLLSGEDFNDEGDFF